MSREVNKSKPFVRTTVPADCIELASTMRAEDKEEIWHSSRKLPLAALKMGINYSDICWSVEWEGRVVAIFGVSRKDELVGIPWMLASDDLKKIRKSFLKESKDYLEQMFQGYTLLANSAWSKNTIHIQWLRWLGFSFLPAKPKGMDGELFYEFYKVNNYV
jgi:hypothetical protein